MKNLIENNNQEKEGSRQHIINFINQNLLNKPKRILELYGAGEGARLMLKQLRLVDKMHLVESERDKQIEMITNLPKKKGTDVVPVPRTLHDYFMETNVTFNIVNLDFCSAFTESKNPNRPNNLVELCFKNNLIQKRGGLLLINVQTAGLNANLCSNAIKDPVVIAKKIKEAAEKHYFKISLKLSYNYLSGKGTRMQILGFKTY